VNRSLAVAIVVLILAALAVRVTQEDGGPTGGCQGIVDAAAMVDDVTHGDQVPTAETFTTAAQELRRTAVAAPGGVAADVHALADAFGQLGILHQGFDPADPATYGIVEQRAPDIEREEARVQQAIGAVTSWLDTTCPG
jgi:hypothetical protein